LAESVALRLRLSAIKARLFPLTGLLELVDRWQAAHRPN